MDPSKKETHWFERFIWDRDPQPVDRLCGSTGSRFVKRQKGTDKSIVTPSLGVSDAVLSGAVATWLSLGTLGSGSTDALPARGTSANTTQPLQPPREHLGASVRAVLFLTFPVTNRECCKCNDLKGIHVSMTFSNQESTDKRKPSHLPWLQTSSRKWITVPFHCN